MRRPSFTLWRATLGDLARLTVLTAAVLVIVTALGATLQPLTDGKLEAGNVVLFVSLACVPMLAYALPFAAGFASTLVYHRVASDNEATAAHAGGVSHRSLLMPAVVMGAVLAGTLTLLNEQVIPMFLQEMQRIVTNDIAKLLLTEVDRGRPALIGDGAEKTIIFADRAERLRPEASSGAMDQVEFTGFCVIQLDREGRPVQELTAQRASLFLYPGSALTDRVDDAGRSAREDDASVAVLVMRNAVGSDPGGVGGFRDETTFVFRVPNIFRDNPKFLSYGRLRRLREHPEDINWIDADRRGLVNAVARVGLVGTLQQSLSSAGALTMTDGEGRPVIVRASGLVQDAAGLRLLPTGERGVVMVSHVRVGSDGDVAQESVAAEAFLKAADPSRDPSGSGAMTLELHKARTREVRSGRDFSAFPERTVFLLHGLRPQVDGAGALATLSSPQLVGEVARSPLRDDPDVARRLETLRRRVEQMRRDVLAKAHERMAMAASCFVMTLTGAVAALRLSRSMPLTVYLWTFFPALACLVTISGGQQMTRNVGAPGLLLMWGGVAGLLAYTLVVYRNLAKH
ncbi:MAG: LptF/LptG family permease [Phycisphaerales bacterium]